MCYMFGRGLEAVEYEARGEGCEGSQQKVLSLHHRAPSSLGGLVTARGPFKKQPLAAGQHLATETYMIITFL